MLVLNNISIFEFKHNPVTHSNYASNTAERIGKTFVPARQGCVQIPHPGVLRPHCINVIL